MSIIFKCLKIDFNAYSYKGSVNMKKIIEKKCIQCGSDKNLRELDNGYYSCIECLDKLGNEQNEMFNYIVNYLNSKGYINPETQIKTLESFIIGIKVLNKLADKELINKLNESMERLDKKVE